MSITDKHRWCISKILETFDGILDADTCQLFMRQEANLNKFSSFFRGDGSGCLFVFYQPVDNGEFSTDEPGPPILSVTTGTDGVMASKCCYFVRNAPPGQQLDLTKGGENDLLYGELGSSALGSIEALLSQSYRPSIDSYDAWGKVDEEQKVDFVNEIGSFINNINDAVSSFANGLDLSSPDPKILRSVENKTNRIGLTSEAVEHFHKLLDEWCSHIERYKNQPLANVDEDDVGPRGELEH